MRLLLIGLLLTIAGCTRDQATTADQRLNIVCTTGMIGDLARTIGGPHVAVTDLFKAGVDPHTYRATTDDLRTLQSARFVFYNGLHLEGKMGAVLEQLGERSSMGIGDALAKLPPPTGSSPRDEIYKSGWLLRDGDHPDPHIWFDVRLWTKMADVVANKLAEIDAAHAADYRQRAAEYIGRLEKLDTEVGAALATIPAEQRVLVTSHDAFRYFGRAYGVQVKGIQGVSTESEASVGHITELVAFLTKSKVKAVFVESSVNPRNMQALREGCEKRGHIVNLGGELFSDAMGDPGTPEGTYEGMIRHNVRTVVEALK